METVPLDKVEGPSKALGPLARSARDILGSVGSRIVARADRATALTAPPMNSLRSSIEPSLVVRESFALS